MNYGIIIYYYYYYLILICLLKQNILLNFNSVVVPTVNISCNVGFHFCIKRMIRVFLYLVCFQLTHRLFSPLFLFSVFFLSEIAARRLS